MEQSAGFEVVVRRLLSFGKIGAGHAELGQHDEGGSVPLITAVQLPSPLDPGAAASPHEWSANITMGAPRQA
jgi:hypothetical protein